MTLLSRATLLTCLFVTAATLAHAENWTRFRGSNGAGQSDARDIPTRWTPEDYAWKIELPGVGHSSPVVFGGKLFILSADPKSAARFVLCVDASSGKQLWRREFDSQSHHLHARNSFASCTPAVDASRIYFAWGTPEKTTLRALTHDGKDAWEIDLPAFVGMHGFGASPMVYNDIVVLNMLSLESETQIAKVQDFEEPGEAFVIAVDCETGETRWKTPHASDVAAYSTPCVYTNTQGQEELICCASGNDVFSLNPTDGKLNWSMSAFTMRTVSSPVIAGGLIFGSTGSGGGGNYVVAVQPPNANDTQPRIKYKVEGKAPYVPTAVAHGELLFLWSDQGIVTCLDAASGEQFWQQRVGGNYSGSPVRVRDAVYCIDEEGNVVVLAAGKKFQPHGKFPLGQASRSTPAVANGRMFLRTESRLFAIGGK